MIKFFYFSLITVLVTSCASFRTPEFRGSEGVKFEKMDGKNVAFTAGVKMFNPNWFGVKIKKSHLDVYVEEHYMGKIYLDKKVKLKAKKESSLIFPLHAVLEDGAMLTVLRYSKAENVAIRFAGKVKGGVWIFSKKMEVNETRNISGKDLRLGMPK